MNASHLLAQLHHGNQLKRIQRTGWVMRGVPNAESVAAHSYGVAFTAMILVPYVDATVDMGRLLSLAILHDLPEGITTDIPSPTWRYMPAGTKQIVEQAALEKMVADSAQKAYFLELWAELQANETIEAQLVHDADKIDMYLQALIYEQQTGNQHLAEFWAKHRTFNLPAAQAVYEELRAQRNAAT